MVFGLVALLECCFDVVFKWSSMALSGRLCHSQFILSPLPAWCFSVTHLELCRLALYWVCAMFCVLVGSVPLVQLLMSSLSFLWFSKKASDEESDLFLVRGV